MAKESDALEKMKLLEERIKAPSIWGRVPCGVRFEDLQDWRYDDAIRLLKKHYLTEEGEITYRSLKIIDDKEGTDEFTHNVRIWMKDKMSIAAVKEGTDKLVGVLIMRIQEKDMEAKTYRVDRRVVFHACLKERQKNDGAPSQRANACRGRGIYTIIVTPEHKGLLKDTVDFTAFSRTFSRVKLTHNPLYSTVMKFYNEIEKPVNVFKELNVKRYFKIYILALKSRYRHRGIAKEMIKAAINLSSSANVPALAGIFTTARSQAIATQIGFTKLNEIYYIRYLIDGEIVFFNTGLGNYGAAMMAYLIPGVEEPEELVAQHSSRFNLPNLPNEEAAEGEAGDKEGDDGGVKPVDADDSNKKE